MFRFNEGLKVYLHRPAVDFRMGINGLALLVEKSLGLNPFTECVYVFRNQRRNRVKILGWDRNGFWLLFKRLEADKFVWPDEATVPTLTAGAAALAVGGHQRGRREAASAAGVRARWLTR
ncbi:IS66 family insertion sequence element accessory protein TnpB [Azohydromonas lata]|uniref:IS66 family insertion sequence element accessory protein TnpB n=1 Tax=Azohydromonas lata TaxID=45677 RepID=A0ABU5IMK2_9BURK|nr:IS66 family insertion sequence element accessory protein TnpB [Azohydromonas lata]MDZ5460115.1 IS66 family insertion sequence element accessory protein TnpB [Azohydromonas lata]